MNISSILPRHEYIIRYVIFWKLVFGNTDYLDTSCLRAHGLAFHPPRHVISLQSWMLPLQKKVVVCKLRHTRCFPRVYMTPGRDTSPGGTSHQKLTVSKSRKVTTPRILPLGHVRLLTPSLSFLALRWIPVRSYIPTLDSQNRFAFLRAWNKCLLNCPVSESRLLTYQDSFSYYSTYLRNEIIFASNFQEIEFPKCLQVLLLRVSYSIAGGNTSGDGAQITSVFFLF